MHAGRRERRRAETRERLFRAALGLFAQRGFLDTRIEDITEAADVGKGTFFNYFPGKEHILGAFGEMQLGKVRAVLAGAGENDHALRPVLRRLLLALAEEPGRSPVLVRSLLGAVLLNENVRRIQSRNLARGRRLLATVMMRGQRQGEIRPDRRPWELARFFMQSFFGTVFFWALDPKEELATRMETTLDFLWRGIARQP